MPALAPPVRDGAPRAWPATNEWGAPAFAAGLPQPEGDSLYAAERRPERKPPSSPLPRTPRPSPPDGRRRSIGLARLGDVDRREARDRSVPFGAIAAGARREPAGRLDRFDALILVVLDVGSLVLRAWHLDQPHDMYFDEVYHARTATEFLQDWRYGIVHSIYEYTHPHVAKYAMALGIEAFGDNKVVSTAQLATAGLRRRARDALEPRDRARASATATASMW